MTERARDASRVLPKTQYLRHAWATPAPCLCRDYSLNGDRAPVTMTDALSNDVLPGSMPEQTATYCASRS